MPEYNLWAEKLCTIYVARPVRPVCAPTEAGHTALWMQAKDAIGLLDNSGDRAFLESWLSWR
jgi:8-oxo-dGTP diphosphatase